jgi:hypothetical protein
MAIKALHYQDHGCPPRKKEISLLAEPFLTWVRRNFPGPTTGGERVDLKKSREEHQVKYC